jgi:hypothetical protein
MSQTPLVRDADPGARRRRRMVYWRDRSLSGRPRGRLVLGKRLTMTCWNRGRAGLTRSRSFVTMLKRLVVQERFYVGLTDAPPNALFKRPVNRKSKISKISPKPEGGHVSKEDTSRRAKDRIHAAPLEYRALSTAPWKKVFISRRAGRRGQGATTKDWQRQC